MSENTNSPELQAVIERIQKIMALANNNPNENEAAAANEKVHALLAQYNLTKADVETKQAEPEPIGLDRQYETLAEPWRYQLGGMVAKMFFCGYFFTTDQHKRMNDEGKLITVKRTNRHHFVGTRANTIVARMMFQYLTETIDRLAKAGALSQPPKERSPYRVSFRHAAALRLCIRIDERIAASKAGTATDEEGRNLPALLSLYEQQMAPVNEMMGKINPKTRDITVSRLHSKGEHDGDQAGKSIGLDQQLGNGESHKRLT